MRKLTIGMLSAGLIAILFSPACTSFVWDPSGSWSFTVTCSHDISWVENLTFTGSEDGGTVSGLQLDNIYSPQTGTYTKTGDYTVYLSFQFTDWGQSITCTMTLTTSETVPNSGTGTGMWEEGSWTDPLDFTATKTSNLQ